MKNIFNQQDNLSKVWILAPQGKTIEALEVTDSQRKGYTERQIQAEIVTQSGNTIEIAPTDKGYIVAKHTPQYCQQVVKTSLLDALRYAQRIAGKGFTVVTCSLLYNDSPIDLHSEVYTPVSGWQ